MTILLFWTVVGFLVGFAYVIKKRQIRPGKVLGAALLGFMTAGFLKLMKEYSRRKKG